MCLCTLFVAWLALPLLREEEAKRARQGKEARSPAEARRTEQYSGNVILRKEALQKKRREARAVRGNTDKEARQSRRLAMAMQIEQNLSI